MTRKELEKIVDRVREELTSRHPEDYDAIDTTCAYLKYEIEKEL